MHLLLAVILLAAAALRFADLGSNPPGFNCDEAMNGLHAHAVATTGRTPHGDFLPLYFHEKTFDRWGAPPIVSPPLQVYSTVPFVWIFGKTEAAIRAPSVCFALLSILGAFLLAREMHGPSVGLLAATLLCLSPLHFNISRIGFEVMSLVAVLTWQAYFLWKGRTSRAYLVAGAATAALATYAYPPGRLFAPLLALGFVLSNWKSLWTRRNDLILATGVALLVLLPNATVILTDPIHRRMYSLLIFSAPTDGEAAVRFLQDHAREGGLWRIVFEERSFRLFILFVSNWLGFYSPSFLFFKGSGYMQHGLKDQGICLLVYVPLLLLGIADCIRKWKLESSRFLIWWFLTFPIPASLTIGSHLSTRYITVFPAFEILCALGLWRLVEHARPLLDRASPHRRRAVFAGVCAVLLSVAALGQAAICFKRYYVDYKNYGAGFWDRGFPEALEMIRRVSPDDEMVAVSDSIMNAYMFILFYSDVEYRTLDPRAPDFEGMLPPKFRVCGPKHPPPEGTKVLWLIRAHERPLHPGSQTVGMIPYPDGVPNMLLIRDP